jgi:hypothetical protein
MQSGFSRGRVVIHGGNPDPFIRRELKVLPLLPGQVFEIHTKVCAMMMKTAHAHHRIHGMRAGGGWHGQHGKAGKTPWK